MSAPIAGAGGIFAWVMMIGIPVWLVGRWYLKRKTRKVNDSKMN